MQDIFDRLAQAKKETDVFDLLKASSDYERVKRERQEAFNKKKEEKIKEEISALVTEQTESTLAEMAEEMATLVKTEVSKIKIPKPVNQIVERIIEKEVLKEPIYTPPRIVEKIVKEPIDLKQYAQKSQIKDLEDQIKSLKKVIEEKDNGIAVQYIGTNIPNFNGQNGKVLSVTNGQLQWEEGGGSADASSGTFVIGPDATEGSWRLIIVGNDLSVQRYESGVWNEKGAFNP